jgi:hypothetical protein
MCIPQGLILVENSPVPGRPIVRREAIKFSSKQLDKELRVVDNREVHQVHSKDVRNREWLFRESREKCLLAQSNGKTTSLEVCLSAGLEKELYIVLVFPRQVATVLVEVSTSDVGMAAPCNAVVIRSTHGWIVV